MRLVVVALSASALAACSSGMSAKQCASADWRSWGYQDGAAGQPYALANTRAAACHQHGVALDHAAYHDGREAGLEEYCTPRRGYELGARGGAYDGVCVRHGEFAFVTEYERGRELFAHTAAVADARRRLDAAHADLAAVNADLSELEGIIAASATGAAAPMTADELARHAREMARLAAHRRDLKRRVIPGAHADLALAEDDLAAYRDSERFAGGATGVSNASFGDDY